MDQQKYGVLRTDICATLPHFITSYLSPATWHSKPYYDFITIRTSTTLHNRRVHTFEVQMYGQVLTLSLLYFPVFLCGDNFLLIAASISSQSFPSANWHGHNTCLSALHCGFTNWYCQFAIPTAFLILCSFLVTANLYPQLLPRNPFLASVFNVSSCLPKKYFHIHIILILFFHSLKRNAIVLFESYFLSSFHLMVMKNNDFSPHFFNVSNSCLLN